jgi:hypothetical protein
MEETKRLTMTGRNIFTPYPDDITEERIIMFISDEDRARTSRGHEWSCVVTDIDSGQHYLVKGASCGEPSCFCAAEIVAPVGTRRAG